MHRSSPLRIFLLLSLVVAIPASVSYAAVQDRVTAAVSNSARTAIPNSVHSRALSGTDLGPAPDSTRMEAMTIRFSMSAAQQAALDQLLLDQQNPASPSYHKWLTPAMYAAQFGLSAEDIAQVTAWLQTQGFTVTEIANSSTFVRFNGTAAQVNSAFATSIHSVSLNGETHYANLTDASVPTAFANVVMGITGLHNFRLKARVRNRDSLTPLTPKYTATSLYGSHFIAPGDFYNIYNVTPLLLAGITGAGIGTGTGKCLSSSGTGCGDIAVMGQTDIIASDITAFRTAAGLSANAPSMLLYGCDPGIYTGLSAANKACDGNFPPDGGDLAESSLDLEWAGAVAPGASILFVYSNDAVGVSLTDAIDNDIAPIMSISYGGCEPSWGTNELRSFNALFKLANSEGITVVAPAGDDGATDCDSNVTSAAQGLAVDFPGSSPYVTSVGGTQFSDGSGSYWNGSQLTLNAGTAGSAVAYSALSYIPEAVWSDISSGYFGGTGGGPSEFFTKPYWQVGTGVPADASRDVPDVALDASDVHDPLLYCVQGSCTTGFSEAITISAPTIAGGTSFATPAFAGILALVEQKTGQRIGNANPTIYALANNSTYYKPGSTYGGTTTSPLVFNDITTGNNNSPCTGGTPYCSGSVSIGYNAGAGYDLATGWGSVNASALVNSWSAVTPIATPSTPGTAVSSTTISPSSSSVVAGATVTLTAQVTGSAGTTPTGTVQFLVNNTSVGAPVTLSSGMATYSLATSCAGLGEQILAASYSGDSLYAGSKGAGFASAGEGNSGGLSVNSQGNPVVTPVQVLVTTGSCPTFSLAPSSSSIKIASGQSPISATITVTPVNGFTGTVTFSASATETSSVAPGFSFSPASVSITSTSPASTTLTLIGLTAALHPQLVPGRPDTGIQLAQQHHAPWYTAGSGAAIACLFVLFVPRRRRLGSLLLIALAMALISGATGCGGVANGVVAANTNTSIGTYTVTVVGTSGSGSSTISQTTQVTFTVN